MDNQAVGRRVWEAVGGQKNVKSLVHCATRLRFRLKDESLADTQKLTTSHRWSSYMRE
ncbi:PTS transporter subunit EIIB [Listeria innocua]